MSIEARLQTLSERQGFTIATITAHYEHRIKVITETYGQKYKGRESHIKALAYRGTEKHYDYNQRVEDGYR